MIFSIVLVVGEAYEWGRAGYVAIGLGMIGFLGATFGQPGKLMIGIASGDQKAFEDVDRAKLNDLKIAIEEAVPLRG